MTTVNEVISKVSFEDVFLEYKKHYAEEHRTKIKEIFQILKRITPSPNHSNMFLFIRAVKENENEEDVVTDSFECDDREVFFDVCGKDDDYEGLYSIASSAYEDILGYFICDKTLTKFSAAQIVAHILWSLDW